MASANQASTLSRLLQRARISTHDPAITQVYATPTAFAVRGEWGFKRPLPSSWQTSPDTPASAPFPGALRYASVHSIDTKQGITDWKEAEGDTLFRKRWQEAGARLSDGERRDTLGTGMNIDDDVNTTLGPRPRTTFDPATLAKDALPHNVVWGANHSRFTDVRDMLPNYNAMSEREFRAYLEKVRRSRNTFRQALRAQRRAAAENALASKLARAAPGEQRALSAEQWNAELARLPDTSVDMWAAARSPHAAQSAASFLQQHSQTRVESPKSDSVAAPTNAAPLHPLRGLQYAQPDSVYTYLLNEPSRGRAVHRTEQNRRNRYFIGAGAGLAVATGGRIGHVPLQHRHGLDVLDYTRARPERGTAPLRVLHAWIDQNEPTTNPRRTPSGTEASEPELGYVRSQLMVLRGREDAPLPGTPRWIDNPEVGIKAPWAQGAESRESGKLFGALARTTRPQGNNNRRRNERRRREPTGARKDVEMLDTIKSLLTSGEKQ
ncbi:hypothetical protein MCUN1_000595 [Malassezia cuniculi]|uniref:Uncharacterized protein n=1 Tax=Malassezia cuniculi TaxID=948313 RepID=A0AAF0J526_9BASI|nr:hypothetical protein MCUN1_000595 [Malassezia cuniculi]